MKVTRQARLQMYQAVEGLGDSNPITIALFPAFSYWFSRFKSKAQQLSESIQHPLIHESVGIEYRLYIKRIICRMIVDTAAPIFEYACSINDAELKGLSSFSYTDLLEMKDEDLIATAQHIHIAAMSNRKALAKYGIAHQVLVLFQAGIDDYGIKIMKLQETVGLKKMILQNNNKLFEEIDGILDCLDDSITAFKDTDPDFVLAYSTCRLVPDMKDFFYT